MRLTHSAAVLLIAASGQQQVSNSYQFPAPVHSLSIGAQATLRAWVTKNIELESDGVFTLANRQNMETYFMFNRYPIREPGFELTFEVQEAGPLETRTAQGFAVWFVEENDIGVFINPAERSDWNLFGYRSRFKGFGVFFATTDRGNQPTASISAAYSGGNKTWDPVTSVPSNDGIYYAFRNLISPLKIRILMGRSTLRGFVRAEGDKDWKAAFTVNVSPEMWNGKEYYFGMSSANARQTPEEKMLLPGLLGDRILISNLKLKLEGASAASFEVPGQKDLRELVVKRADLDPVSGIRTIAEVTSKHVLPPLELLLERVHDLGFKYEQLSNRMDILHAYLTKGSMNPELKKAVEEVGAALSLSAREQSNKLSELHHKLETHGVQELHERSASLENTIKSHTQLSSYLTISLGSIAVLFGAIIYKRMRDMEKKHIL